MLTNVFANNRGEGCLTTVTDRTPQLYNSLPEPLPRLDTPALAAELVVGDVVFICVSALPFRKVDQTTLSWTNHVGIVVETEGGVPRVAESTFPISKTTPLSRFVARSTQGRVAVRRLLNPPSHAHQAAIRLAASRRLGIMYDTGFNLRSRRQFCSRFVHEVLAEATGQMVGEIESFSGFLEHNPNVDLLFWRLWYFGRIPWQRETVTPASLLHSSAMRTLFDGYAEKESQGPSVYRGIEEWRHD